MRKSMIFLMQYKLDFRSFVALDKSNIEGQKESEVMFR